MKNYPDFMSEKDTGLQSLVQAFMIACYFPD